MIPNKFKSSGITIAEVLIASSLLLLITGSMLAVVKVTQDRFARMNALLDMEENLFLAANFLSNDLSLGNANTVEVLADNFISFPHPFDLGGELLGQSDGSLNWGIGVAYYKETLDNKSFLVRQLESLSSPSSQAIKLSSFEPPLGTNFFFTGSGQKRKIAEGLESLSVSVISAREVEFSLELKRDFGSRQRGVQIVQRVACRN